MRLLNFLKPAKKTKHKRAPLRPAWHGRAVKLAASGLVIAGIGGATGWLWHTGIVGQYGSALAGTFSNTTKALGLTVSDVLVEGRDKTNRRQLLEALEVSRGDNILTVDLTAARDRLEALSWIKTAAVERRLPDTIFVKLVERTPMALWQRNATLYLVDDSGEIITRRNLGQYSDLPILIGNKAPVRAKQMLETLASEPDLKGRIKALTWVGDRRWTIRLDNDVDVQLPEENPAGAWAHFANLERSHGLLSRDVIAVDLRLPDQLVVRVAPKSARQMRTPGKDT